MTPEQHIIQSWQTNAAAWTEAVRARQVESRRLVTDQAIVRAVNAVAPKTLLDLGCGEGWLARTLGEQGVDVLGVDVVESMIAAARKLGGARFECLSYEQLIDGQLAQTFGAVVCNFSLFDRDTVTRLFEHMPALLTPRGSLIVQTLHPASVGEGEPYRDGWRQSSWEGFGEAFSDPAPWYFRTLSSWISLFVRNGFGVVSLQEPLDPRTGRAASLILTGRLLTGQA